MAEHDLIDDYLARLARHLPADAVAELADGLAETYDRHLGAGLAGDAAAAAAIAASEAAFTGAPITDPAVLRTLHRETGGFSLGAGAGGGEASLLDVLVDAGIFASRGEARRMIQNGGLSVNDARVTDADAAVPAPLAGEWLVVRVGKRKLHVGRLERA